jgi:hypothetical protein
MPPIRTASSQKSANQEGKILLALDDIKNGCIKSIRVAAKLYTISRSTLQIRAHSTVLRTDTHPNGYKLTPYEKDSLTKWIISIDLRGVAPRPSTIRKMANILLKAYGTTPLLTISIN